MVHIELLAEGGNININQELIRAGLAIAAEETYESKVRLCNEMKSNSRLEHDESSRPRGRGEERVHFGTISLFEQCKWKT